MITTHVIIKTKFQKTVFDIDTWLCVRRVAIVENTHLLALKNNSASRVSEAEVS
jgi:hypothetical protein